MNALPGPGTHGMFFIRDLLFLREALPCCFLIGNPPAPLHRVRVLGTVVATATTHGRDGSVCTTIVLDDSTGTVPVTLPQHLDAPDGYGLPSSFSQIAWCAASNLPSIGDCVDVFGTLRSGYHPALTDNQTQTHRYVAAVGWIVETDPLQEAYRALQIRALYAQYFRDGYQCTMMDTRAAAATICLARDCPPRSPQSVLAAPGTEFDDEFGLSEEQLLALEIP